VSLCRRVEIALKKAAFCHFVNFLDSGGKEHLREILAFCCVASLGTATAHCRTECGLNAAKTEQAFS
jgi:hypothetical protein